LISCLGEEDEEKTAYSQLEWLFIYREKKYMSQ